MPWWSWILTGLFLLVLELATPGGFFLFFFGLSGLVVGLATYAGLMPAEAAQWGTFSVLAILSIALFRKKLLALLPVGLLSKSGKGDTDSLVGKEATASEVIAPAAIGKVDFRGTSWNARNMGSARIESGAVCLITSVDGITLSVKSI